MVPADQGLKVDYVHEKAYKLKKKFKKYAYFFHGRSLPLTAAVGGHGTGDRVYL